ncbi:actin-related protein 2/3 complex subunit 3 [Zopfochytrium polystomum]|nr:actin-related protein 2/3 complex subunit 3 [Zopfochytrium polystomum]
MHKALHSPKGWAYGIAAFHSSLNALDTRFIGNVALLPIKTKVRGPAPPAVDLAADDIIDEAIYYFRPNCFFRNFEIGGGADRVLIYVQLFIQECLGKLAAAKNPNASDGARILATHALQNFSIPGEAGFPLNAMYEKPATKLEQDTLRQYFSQIRQETSARLTAKLYDGNTLSKWWMSFSKKKFMGIASVGTLV